MSDSFSTTVPAPADLASASLSATSLARITRSASSLEAASLDTGAVSPAGASVFSPQAASDKTKTRESTTANILLIFISPLF